jgi:hypothetical protein
MQDSRAGVAIRSVLRRIVTVACIRRILNVLRSDTGIPSRISQVLTVCNAPCAVASREARAERDSHERMGFAPNLW